MHRRWVGLVLGVTITVALAAPPSAAVDGPTVVATPHEALLDHHEVAVTVTGLEPGGEYAVLDCAGDACVDPAMYDLTFSTLATPLSEHFDPRRRFVTASSEGTASTTVSVRRVIDVGGDFEDPDAESRTADCSAEPCTLAVAGSDDEVVVASTPLTFAATGSYAWPAATASLSPDAPYIHGQGLEVSGSGFTPDIADLDAPWLPGSLFGIVTTQQCVAGTGAPCEAPDPVEQYAGPSPVLDVADDGTVSGTITADRFVKLSATDTRDCAVEDCTLTAFQPGKSRSAALPLDFGPVWAPWTSAGAMVDGLCTLLGAQSMHDGDRAPLVQGLVAGTTSVVDVVRAIALHAPAPGDVATLYAALLGHRPDLAGLRYWVDRLQHGTPAGRLADIFSNTPEVRSHHADLDDAGAIDWTYGAVLGRVPDADGKAYWLGRLAAGLPRHRMTSMFALATESRTRTADRRVITAATLGLADREPLTFEWSPGTGFPPVLPAGPAGFRTALWDVIDASPAFRTT